MWSLTTQPTVPQPSCTPEVASLANCPGRHSRRPAAGQTARVAALTAEGKQRPHGLHCVKEAPSQGSE